MSTLDPKTFYDTHMPEKYGPSYEQGRWERSAFERAQYQMMDQVMRHLVLPHAQSPKHVLEIGPGPGTWTKYLLEATPGASFTLVDISDTMLTQARSSLPNSVEFIVSDWTAYVPTVTFDFFFSSRALEYVSDKVAALDIVARSLVSGGKGAIITKTPKPFFDRLRGRKNAIHSGQIAPRTLVKLLRAQGFLVRSVRIATATVPLLQSPTINRLAFALLGRMPLIPLFSESYVVLFEKM